MASGQSRQVPLALKRLLGQPDERVRLKAHWRPRSAATARVTLRPTQPVVGTYTIPAEYHPVIGMQRDQRLAARQRPYRQAEGGAAVHRATDAHGSTGPP